MSVNLRKPLVFEKLLHLIECRSNKFKWCRYIGKIGQSTIKSKRFSCHLLLGKTRQFTETSRLLSVSRVSDLLSRHRHRGTSSLVAFTYTTELYKGCNGTFARIYTYIEIHRKIVGKGRHSRISVYTGDEILLLRRQVALRCGTDSIVESDTRQTQTLLLAT